MIDKKNRNSKLKIRKTTDWNGKTNSALKQTKIKVCFCPQKRMSPPVPQTVVKGKKSI